MRNVGWIVVVVVVLDEGTLTVMGRNQDLKTFTTGGESVFLTTREKGVLAEFVVITDFHKGL